MLFWGKTRAAGVRSGYLYIALAREKKDDQRTTTKGSKTLSDKHVFFPTPGEKSYDFLATSNIRTLATHTSGWRLFIWAAPFRFRVSEWRWPRISVCTPYFHW
ncbi:hypothetical protein TRIATDRAFT_159079 [Trichoderma atroviride IMI 206040]|uniref:Uncharacterized protein n=1 Tax=Hypocrea atroviridis (strain ATCC 20476 / IMI 206040) TaxID=452589 RepID=G9P6W1_HYPAI|nr:uncharacterized protein TRIATDRAFT_159079 [Trichoderma atroviride IMI 206040]EHK40686.1 hypothetical protein TRIATDRAFT_159079 [Trichoderma atroviride IMI 206040]